MTDAPPHQRLKFDPTISAGNILTAVAMLIALVAWGMRLESRVDSTAARLEVSERRLETSERRLDLALTEVRDSNREIMLELRTVMEQTEQRWQAGLADLRAGIVRIENYILAGQGPRP